MEDAPRPDSMSYNIALYACAESGAAQQIRNEIRMIRPLDVLSSIGLVAVVVEVEVVGGIHIDHAKMAHAKTTVQQFTIHRTP